MTVFTTPSMSADVAAAIASSTIDSAMDAIITVDERQQVVIFNAAAEAMFGWTRGEALGAPLDAFIPSRFRHRHGALVQRFGEEGPPTRKMAQDRIVTGLRRNGEEFPIDASISHMRDGAHCYYTVILRDVTRRLQAIDDLTHSRAETKALAAAAQDALEHEKRRIARELHDELGQSLTLMRMDVAWCKEHAGALDAAVAARLVRMEELLKSTVAATRRIASDLRPLMLDDLGLAPALEWLVQSTAQRTGIDLVLHMGERVPHLPPALSTAVFRIVQEALTNISKHAQARSAQISVACDERHLHVRVHDDGVGFDVEGPRKPASFGLLGLRERASLAQGSVRIDSTPGSGTTIDIALPLPVQDATA